MYQPKVPWKEEIVPIRGIPYHIKKWGPPQNECASDPLLFFLHGWMDMGASFQFMVDALSSGPLKNRQIIAPDWRGFGQTPAGVFDTFFYQHYLGDLDALIDHYSPSKPVDLLGHSLGGNVVTVYAAVRPERVHHLINVEGFGPPYDKFEYTPKKIADWLNDIKRVQDGSLHLKPYDSLVAVAERLQKTNPRLPQDKALWLADNWAQKIAAGRWEILAHPAHLLGSPNAHYIEEMLACYQKIACPTLFVKASEDSLITWWRGSFTMQEFDERINHVPDLKVIQLPDCSHMLHHDQPEKLACTVEDFLLHARL